VCLLYLETSKDWLRCGALDVGFELLENTVYSTVERRGEGENFLVDHQMRRKEGRLPFLILATLDVGDEFLEAGHIDELAWSRWGAAAIY